jgi:flagellar protein FlaG
MADQVNPMGSLAPGLPLMPLVASKPQPVEEKPRVAKSADPQPTKLADGRTDTSAESFDAAVRAVKDYVQKSQSDLQFQVEEGTGRIYFKIVDAQTKQVIRQVPSEEILAMARKLREMANPKSASGVLVDKEG